jgi:nucleoside-diphosphate-sugar epimerase
VGKRILITGGSGFIGHHLVRSLRSEGYDIYNIDLASEDPLERIDIRDLKKLSHEFEEIKPDVVIHLAAVASIPICEEDPSICFDTNVKGTFNVAYLASKYDAKIIFASSSAVYGKPKVLPTPVSHPYSPVNVYGLTKALGEQIIMYYGKSYVIFRIFNVYGPECNRSYVIPDVIRKVLRGENPVRLLGTGEEARDFIYITDVIEAFKIAIRQDTVGIFNLGSGKTYKIKDIANMIKNIMGKNVDIVFEGKPRPRDLSVNWADISDAIPGWKPRVDLIEGLKETIAWYLHN